LKKKYYIHIMDYDADIHHGPGPVQPPFVVPSEKKWMYALMAAVLAVLIFSPFAFKLVDNLTSALGFSVANSSGCPTMVGLLVHGVVFLLLVRALMYERTHDSL
jgi:hypothetical protein